MAETREVRVQEVKAFKTSSGNTRFVLVDDTGNEYTTFREGIARKAVEAEGRRARIKFHEQERNGFTNVYLDAVEVLEEAEAEPGPRPTGKSRKPPGTPRSRRPRCSSEATGSARFRPISCSRR